MKKQKMSTIIMGKIRKEHIAMRPKMYFTTLNYGKKIFLIISIALTLLFTNVSIFKFRIYDPFGFLVFGRNGLVALFGLLPVYIIIFALTSFICFSFIVSFFDISYKRSYVGVLTVMLFTVIGGGFMIDKTGINEEVKKAHALPSLYYGRYVTDKWIMGEIKNVDSKKKTIILLIPFEGGEQIVEWDNKTTFPNYEKIKIGAYIKVIGTKKSDTFLAEGIVQTESPITH